jgi:hypothetical protein
LWEPKYDILYGRQLFPKSNVFSEEKKKQVIAFGKIGWSWRRIEEATGVHG